MNDPRARQAKFNAESSDQWDGFSGHRGRISGLLSGGSGQLCVLGAGNGNDLDLAALLDAYREVHLVDLDAGAMARGVERQGMANRAGLVEHGGLDVTGMVDAMTRWSPLEPIASADLQALVDWPAQRVGLALPGPFDLVASTCLLSQLIANAHHAIGEAHPQFLPVIRAIRLGHLRLLSQLIRPGGGVVLITDVASSDWVPELAELPDSSLPGLIASLAVGRGLIHGVNPVELLDIFQRDRVVSARLADARVLPPWRWRLHSRTYLVTAIVARAKLGAILR